ncbi:UDP-N-acetyl-D-mannosamine dehydrogenase [ANME-1 cluster archaeon AG-394-G21]|nr:UDP-N-acetyl-D-mannosamine dehydrogenase [ANME-1 cluster archaeon AG-394-G21]
MKICVLGLGYIGLPTACLFANANHEVIGIDINQKTIEKLNNKELPFEEKGLEDLFENALPNMRFKTQVEEADVFIIAVSTPLNKEMKMAELKYVRSAAEMIYSQLRKDNLVILESTVPPGTCDKLLVPVLEKSGLKVGDFQLAHCPERAIPGNTIYEMVNNDRIIGGIDKKSAKLAKSLYSSFVKGNFYLTNAITAEFVKLMENTFRDINIALANEFAQIAEESGVNVWEAIELANKHPRVNILKPGPGVGGHCIAIDPWFLTENTTRCRIVSLAREINEGMPNHILQIVKRQVDDIKDPVVTVFGVAYKGGVDDTRETPALKFIKLAENEGYKVKVHDPHVKEFEYGYEILGLEESVIGSDCIVLITDHPEFKNVAQEGISRLMRNKNVVDTRKMLDTKRWKEAGFNVNVIGVGH